MTGTIAKRRPARCATIPGERKGRGDGAKAGSETDISADADPIDRGENRTVDHSDP
jgi:hypothetical protein